MSKVFVVSKKQIRMAAILTAIIVLAFAYLKWDQSQAASSVPGDVRIFHLVTGEFSSTDENGKEIEVYRWDPGSLTVSRGEQVELHITGVSGTSHPFVIEGLGVQGEVRKGKTTVVKFTAEHAGTYPILCLTHTAQLQGGPMVGYIRVQ